MPRALCHRASFSLHGKLPQAILLAPGCEFLTLFNVLNTVVHCWGAWLAWPAISGSGSHRGRPRGPPVPAPRAAFSEPHQIWGLAISRSRSRHSDKAPAKMQAESSAIRMERGSLHFAMLFS